MKSARALPAGSLQDAALKVDAYHRAEMVRSYYLAANVLVVVTMALALWPGAGNWIWLVVGVASLAVLALGIVMMTKSALANGLICLLFASIILPGWAVIVPAARSFVLGFSKEVSKSNPLPKAAPIQTVKGHHGVPVVTPSPIDGAIEEAKDWIAHVLVNTERIKYVRWTNTEKGAQITSDVIFTALDSHNVRIEERLTFVFDRYETEPLSVYNHKTESFLFERPLLAGPPRDAK